jgi:hypothetical protein
VHSREVDGVAIDSGPTVFTMRWVLDDALAAAAWAPASTPKCPISPLQVLARHFWPDGSQLGCQPRRVRRGGGHCRLVRRRGRRSGFDEFCSNRPCALRRAWKAR